MIEVGVPTSWSPEATEPERRTLVEELLESVAVFPDHLEVTVAGAPRLNVLLSEVGLKESLSVGVEGGSSTASTWPAMRGVLDLAAS